VAVLTDYSFGSLRVDGERHSKDLIVLPHRVVPDWWRREGHSLAMQDFDEVIDELPDRLILGCGAHARLEPPSAVLDELRARGVEVETMPTADAVRRYGELDPEHTAAALHLTC
jgi:hypothetical protein